MTTLIYPDPTDNAQLWRMVGLSLALHALVVVIYPNLSQIQLPKMPERLEIEFFSVKAPPPSPQPAVEVPTPVEPPKPMPKPEVKQKETVETPKPVLAAPDNSQAEYRVPEPPPVPVKVEPAPVTPTPVTPAPVAPSVNNENQQHSSSENASKDARPNVAAHTTATQESDELAASDTDAWGDYGEQLRSLVNKSKQYPPIAIRRHLEGEATVVAQFVKGELVNVSLADSSKHVPLDEEAMRMVKKAIAQLGVKDSLKKKSFKITIPVAFKLE